MVSMRCIFLFENEFSTIDALFFPGLIVITKSIPKIAARNVATKKNIIDLIATLLPFVVPMPATPPIKLLNWQNNLKKKLSI